MDETMMLNARKRPLQTPDSLLKQLPMTDEAAATVNATRQQVQAIFSGQSNKKLVILGPKAVRNPAEALNYAEKIKALQNEYADRLCIIMRVCTEASLTRDNSRGFLYDPLFDGSNRVQLGLYKTRELLININAMGVAAATDLVDPLMPQYFGDLISWFAVGSQAADSSTHRSLASGLPTAVGFHNTLSGNIQAAVDGASIAQKPQQCLNIDYKGRVTLCENVGNPCTHTILCGGDMGSNFDAASIKHTAELMNHAGINPSVIVHCGQHHVDSSFNAQKTVVSQVCQSMAQTDQHLKGVVLDSDIEGRGDQLSWDESEQCVSQIAESVQTSELAI